MLRVSLIPWKPLSVSRYAVQSTYAKITTILGQRTRNLKKMSFLVTIVCTTTLRPHGWSSQRGISALLDPKLRRQNCYLLWRTSMEQEASGSTVVALNWKHSCTRESCGKWNLIDRTSLRCCGMWPSFDRKPLHLSTVLTKVSKPR